MTDLAAARQSLDVLPAPEPPPAPDFAEIYAAELDYVWRTLRRLGAGERDLEDLAHEVFLVVFRRLDSYDPARPLRPWLFGIAFRVAAHYWRTAYRRRELPCQAIERPSEDGGPERELEAARARRLVRAALAEVPLDQRAAVILHDIDGFSAPEIAEALELPVNTVYSRLRLGRAKLTTAARRLRGHEKGKVTR